MIPESNPERIPRYRGISYRRPIDAAKEAVPVIDLADRLCGPGGLRRVGKEWVGRCPLPGHDDRVPSFSVNPDKGLFYCHGCVRGGDVVELARLAWGYTERDARMAAADLLHEFGVDIPARPPAWFAKQKRQKPVRDALEEVRVRSAQRRLMRICEPLVADIEDPEVRREEAYNVLRDCGQVARLMVKARRR